MAKVGIDVSTTPRQAGYIADNSSITGISLMHDEGTGGNTAGGYGIFPLFPLTNCSFSECPVRIGTRAALRTAGADGKDVFEGETQNNAYQMSAASPGYFTTKFVNGIQLETTSTRRAGLIRFTYPEGNSVNHVVVDLTNDLQRSFEGGGLSIADGRITLHGTFLQVSPLSLVI